MILTEATLREFIDVLSSTSPAPGGGSAAALSGALGASLVAMVCRLTIGKKGYEEHEALIKSSLIKAEQLANSLLDAVQKDTEAFDSVMAAFALPKATDDEKETRRETIQEAFKAAVASPENIAVKCLNILEIAEEIVDKCNSNAISDIAVGALEAWAGLQGALLNIRINLPSIKDTGYVDHKRKWIAEITDEGERLSEEIKKEVSRII
ncbi:MAG: cyclodeaminase/cyclohydrolase family protein [Synergistaceae bacterium]|nr:cyclodeaminase/cyclohydrolase family protein [Synergistaceae bacterium]